MFIYCNGTIPPNEDFAKGMLFPLIALVCIYAAPCCIMWLIFLGGAFLQLLRVRTQTATQRRQ
jgi:hypothetical protein